MMRLVIGEKHTTNHTASVPNSIYITSNDTQQTMAISAKKKK